PSPGRELVAQLMQAAAWTSRARRHRGLAPMTVADLVRAFSAPIDEWLPGAGSFLLVEDGQPSPICMDLGDDAGSSALAEAEQRVIKTVMNNLAGHPEAARVYTEFRKFIVEHAHAPTAEAAKIVRSVGLDLAQIYVRVAVDCNAPWTN